MTEEEKGFVIKDRRAFDEEGDLKDKTPEEAETKGEPGKEKNKEAKKEASEEVNAPPLPEVNFPSLIFSLSSTALFHFGEIADPQTNEKKKDLPLAKHTIDTIAMLKEKTEGNLSGEEQQFIDSVLTDLRWRYVKATK